MAKKLTCGVGINDCVGWSPKSMKGAYEYRVYNTWHSMLRRCYSKKYQERKPTYTGCTVCERWLTLSNFAEDIKGLPNYDLYVKGTHTFLDKDIRVPGNKIYSPDTCMFVTPSESSKDVYRRNGIKIVASMHTKEAHRKRFSNKESYFKMAKTQSRPVKAVKTATGEESIFLSQKEASEILGVSETDISACVKGRQKTAGGFRFIRVSKEDI